MFRLAFALYFIYFIFATIGTFAFGGKISIDIVDELAENNECVDSSFVYQNFNDFGQSIVTLFGITAVNGWERIVCMYVLVEDGTAFAVICYFVVFLMLVTFIIMNILTTFVVDTYT
jgi:hypothetical protein